MVNLPPVSSATRFTKRSSNFCGVVPGSHSACMRHLTAPLCASAGAGSAAAAPRAAAEPISLRRLMVMIVSSVRFLLVVKGSSPPPQTGEDFRCTVGADIVGSREFGGDLVDLVAGGAGHDGDVAGMERHMAALDAFGGKRPERRHVLRQADR